jgi:hypothetical protein
MSFTVSAFKLDILGDAALATDTPAEANIVVQTAAFAAAQAADAQGIANPLAVYAAVTTNFVAAASGFAILVDDYANLGYPFNRSWGFASTVGPAKVAPSWADVRGVSAALVEQPLGSGS